MKFRISLKNSAETQDVDASELLDVCEELSQGGRLALDVKRINADGTVETETHPMLAAKIDPKADTLPPPPPAPEAPPALGFSSFDGPLVTDATAKARIEAQHAALISGGVTVNAKEQLFETGTRMAAEGYATQARRKAEHDRMLTVREAAEGLIQQVLEEKRVDLVVSAGAVARGIHANGKITVDGYAIGEQAIRGLASRLESPMLGYVLGIRDRIASRKGRSDLPDGEIRARNDEDRARIAEVIRHECLQHPDERFKMRVRHNGANGKPDCYAIVGEGYSPADAPDAVGQLLDQLPSDAKASFAYDPDTTTWELRASVWTPTPVAEQAVGEAFEGYVSFSSKDNGTSRFRGGGGVTLLRCLNASTYAAEGANVARVHRGRILYAVGRMVSEAKQAIDALSLAWGKNHSIEIEVPTEHPKTHKRLTIEDVIPGFYMSMLRAKTSELVGVLPGQTRTHAAGLTRAFFAERREPAKLVRSDLAQGWTKYIQDQPTSVRRDAEKAIGDWLMNPGTVMKCDLT